jgi:hypothetical protein
MEKRRTEKGQDAIRRSRGAEAAESERKKM